MTRTTLKTTTALILSFSLALPTTGFSQGEADKKAEARDAQAMQEAQTQKKLAEENKAGKSKKQAEETKADKPRKQAEPVAEFTRQDRARLRELLALQLAAKGNPDLRFSPEDRTEMRGLIAQYSAAKGNPGNKLSPEEMDALRAELGVAPAAPAETATEAKADPDAGLTDRERAERRRAKAEAKAQRQAEREARAAEQAAAAAADGAAGGEITRQVVTEEDARAAGEEFRTALDPAPAAATAQKDDNDLAKKLGAAALLGLGAYAVGKMLSNGDQVVANTGDRVVVEREGDYYVLKDDDTLLRQPGSVVETERFADGSTRSRVTGTDGVAVETVTAADGRVLRRTRVMPDGSRVVLFDDTRAYQPVNVALLPETSARQIDYAQTDAEALRQALLAANAPAVDRGFSLYQIRNIDAVRKQVPELTLEAVNFATGSAVIRAPEAAALSTLGKAMREAIARNPGELFLIEGHTDAVGSATYNLALSDRRAESLAQALIEYFDVPAENMIVQGYGEEDLRVDTEAAEAANRRAAVRRITPLLQMAQR